MLPVWWYSHKNLCYGCINIYSCGTTKLYWQIENRGAPGDSGNFVIFILGDCDFLTLAIEIFLLLFQNTIFLYSAFFYFAHLYFLKISFSEKILCLLFCHHYRGRLVAQQYHFILYLLESCKYQTTLFSYFSQCLYISSIFIAHFFIVWLIFFCAQSSSDSADVVKILQWHMVNERHWLQWMRESL